jgi:hypothetical protein
MQIILPYDGLVNIFRARLQTGEEEKRDSPAELFGSSYPWLLPAGATNRLAALQLQEPVTDPTSHHCYPPSPSLSSPLNRAKKQAEEEREGGERHLPTGDDKWRLEAAPRIKSWGCVPAGGPDPQPRPAAYSTWLALRTLSVAVVSVSSSQSTTPVRLHGCLLTSKDHNPPDYPDASHSQPCSLFAARIKDEHFKI